ncbi:MAG: YceI family protein [Chromatiaceae bacterium]|jgi:polyisoprenoid-binding protein YceI
MYRFLAVALSLISTSCFAWQLQPTDSSLSFVSIKKDSVGEVMHFKKLTGSLDNSGTAVLSVPLASVETGIPVRDERMRDLLFQVAQYPKATFQGTIDMKTAAALKAGDQAHIPVKGQLSLHGKSAEISADTLATKLADGRLSVVTTEPVIVHTGDFGLNDGVKKLMEVAGLPAISRAVPVTFALTFTP